MPGPPNVIGSPFGCVSAHPRAKGERAVGTIFRELRQIMNTKEITMKHNTIAWEAHYG